MKRKSLNSLTERWAARHRAPLVLASSVAAPVERRASSPRTAQTATVRRAELLDDMQQFSQLGVYVSNGRVRNRLWVDKGALVGARAEIARPASSPDGGTLLAIAVAGRAHIGHPGRLMVVFADGTYIERGYAFLKSGRVAADIARFNALAVAYEHDDNTD